MRQNSVQIVSLESDCWTCHTAANYSSQGSTRRMPGQRAVKPFVVAITALGFTVMTEGSRQLFIRVLEHLQHPPSTNKCPDATV